MRSVVLCAHPDDESLFFGGLLLERKDRGFQTEILCLTNTGKTTRERQRRRELEKAAERLGVTHLHFGGLRDQPNTRLRITEIHEIIDRHYSPSLYDTEVFTHGSLGEYGHSHHQDLSYAAVKYFTRVPVFGVAYHNRGTLNISLSSDDFKIKCDILSQIYPKEFFRFFNTLPSRAQESFYKIPSAEAEHLYGFLAQKKTLKKSHLTEHAHLFDFLKSHQLEKNYQYFLYSYFQKPLPRTKTKT